MTPPPAAHPHRGLPLAGLLLALLAGLAVVLLAGGPAAAQPDPAPGPQPIPAPPSESPPTPPDPGTPHPEPGPPPIPPDEQDGPAPWDIAGQVRKAITDFFHNLVENTLNPVLETMGETVLATPDLTGNEQIRAVWTANLVIANTIFVLFIVAAGFIVASRETLQAQYGLKELAPRIVVAGLASNLSLLVVGQVIELANAVTAGIAGQGVDPATAAQALAGIWENAATGTNFLASLLMIAIVVMAIIVMITFIIRVAVLSVLLMVAPLALLFHALPQTEGLAFTWWKAVAGCFAIQFGQTVVLMAAVTIFLTPIGPTVLGFPSSGSGWLGILVALAMMWLLVKIPMWVKDYMWLHSRGVLRKVIFALVMLKTVSLAAAGRGHHRGGGRPQQRPGRPGPQPGPRPRPGPGPRPAPTPRLTPGPGPRHRPNPRQRPNPGPRPSPRPGPVSGADPSSEPSPGPRPASTPQSSRGAEPTSNAGAGAARTTSPKPGPAAEPSARPVSAPDPRPAPAATGQPVRYSGTPQGSRPASSAPPRLSPSRPAARIAANGGPGNVSAQGAPGGSGVPRRSTPPPSAASSRSQPPPARPPRHETRQPVRAQRAEPRQSPPPPRRPRSGGEN
jgi:hypothetical protein